MNLDLIARAVLVVVFGGFATLTAARLQFASPDATALDMAAMLIKLVFLILVSVLAIVRLPPLRNSIGWEPRVSALAGTFLLLALVALPQDELHPAIRSLAIILIVCGSALSVYSLYWLGRSFSIMAQARKLVTGGPYGIVRHPLYVSEAIASLGVVLNQFSPEAVALFVLQLAFQLRRAANEERVLRAEFPEYESYARSTPRIFPDIRRWMNGKPAEFEPNYLDTTAAAKVAAAKHSRQPG